MLRSFAALLVVVLLAAGCGGTEEEEVSPPSTIPPPSTSSTLPTGAPPTLKLTEVATFDEPVAMVQRDGADDFFVAEKKGRVMLLRNGAKQERPILDLSDQVSTDGERGLLGLAFKPNSSSFYVDYTDKAGDTHIDEYTLGSDGTASLSTKRELLIVDQPYANHNGGQLAFGPDGYLYIAFGDGGSGGDPQKQAQNLTSLLGKILRINVEPTASSPYTVPYDNPFLDTAGARPEIWAYGLRNPWRFSFDRRSGALWIADVGQGNYEEINYVTKDPTGGQNYGWPLREGLHKQDGEAPKGAIDPVYEYDHSAGNCSVTGGYSYGGSSMPEMLGRYVFGDYCSGKIWTLTLRGTTWEMDPLSINVASLTSFAEDTTGELYNPQPKRCCFEDPTWLNKRRIKQHCVQCDYDCCYH